MFLKNIAEIKKTLSPSIRCCPRPLVVGTEHPDGGAGKKLHATGREMTTPLFLLRCVQLGLSIGELDLLTIGLVNDVYVEVSR